MEKRVPSATDAEQGVLTCILSNPSHMALVAEMLSPEDFQQDEYRTIYTAMQTLFQAGRACHKTNVTRELQRRNELEQVGGTLFLEHLAYSLESLVEIEEHADEVKRVSRYRQLISAAARIAKAAYDQDENAVEIAEQLIYDIALGVSTSTVATAQDMMNDYIRQLDERRADLRAGQAHGVPTGFRDLDHLLGGLQPSRLYVIAARPSLGKTAIALNMALNIVQHSRHALFFSLEMDNEEISQRLLSMETHIDQAFLQSGDISDMQMQDVRQEADRLAKCDLKCDDRTYTLSDLRSKARRIHAQKKLDVIVVDYLQLIESSVNGRAKNESRAEEIAKLSRGLKRLARELRVPIIGLAQLNRDIERRAGGMPQLSDLGEGSGIEKDSDCVMFLHCDETELEKRNSCLPYRLNVIVRKHRNGRIGQVALTFRPRLTKFQDVEEGTYAD